MSTEDQTLSAALHGEALLTARRPELQPPIDHLREAAQGRDDLRTEVAGIIAGSWFASGVRRGEELIAAGLLMLAGPILILTSLTSGCGLVGSGGVVQQVSTQPTRSGATSIRWARHSEQTQETRPRIWGAPLSGLRPMRTAPLNCWRSLGRRRSCHDANSAARPLTKATRAVARYASAPMK